MHIANLVRNVPISRIWQHAATVKFSPGVPGFGGGVNISEGCLLVINFGILERFLSGLIVGVSRNGKDREKYAFSFCVCLALT